MDPEDTLVLEAEEEARAEGEELLEGEAAGAGAAGGDEGEGSGEGEGDDGGSIVTIEGEAPPAEEDDNAAPTWVRDLRKSNREKDRALRERDAEIARLKGSPAQQAAVVVGEEPTFEGCDYDPDKFKAATLAWSKRKDEVENQERTRTQVQEQQQAQWTTRLKAVDTAASKLGVKNHDEAMSAFEDQFSPVQRGIILGGLEDAKTSAAMRYALGMNPKKAKELAAIADPVKFAIAIGKLEDKLTIAPRKTAPVPERTLRSTGPTSGAVDSQLERLRADADKTGDYTKVHQYRQQQRAKRK